MKYIIPSDDVSASRDVIGRQKCYGAHGDRLAGIPLTRISLYRRKEADVLSPRYLLLRPEISPRPYRRALIHPSGAALRQPHTPLLFTPKRDAFLSSAPPFYLGFDG